MSDRTVWLLAAAVFLPAAAAAQQQPWQPPPPIEQRWPGDPPRAQQQPAPTQPQQQSQQSQRQQPPQQSQQQPPQQAPARAAPPAAAQGGDPPRAARPAPSPQPARAIACSGPFAKNSGHLQLAARFGSENIVFDDVDGPDRTKVKATILYPKDPKRRLEVWWNNEAARSDMALIVINGQSTWTSPKGVRLGLPLAALEKLNGRPFLLSGLDADNMSAVTDWQGGALAKLPGDCKMSVRLAVDAQAPDAARAELAKAKTLASSDVNMRAAKPVVREILIGY